MTITRLLLLGALAPTAVSVAQSDPIVESRAHYRAAVEAYEARDPHAFLQHARKAHALRPAHGGVTYALASAFALTGDTAGALATLRHFAVLGYSADLAADSDFVRLHGNEAYAELARRLKSNGEPVVVSEVAFELPQRALLTEGIAHDARDDVCRSGAIAWSASWSPLCSSPDRGSP